MVPKRVLVIDNSPLQCKELSRIFGKLGYGTIAAYSALDGFRLVSLNDPNLIVLDLLLLDMDGLEVCEQLKKNAQTQRIPLVLFTGCTRIVDIMRGFAANLLKMLVVAGKKMLILDF